MRGAIGWDAPEYLPVAAVAVAAGAALAVALYRGQLRHAGWFWRVSVPVFRAAAVVALGASVLRPTVLRPISPDDRAEIVAIVGVSPTMSVADQSWTPAERVSLAAGLGELPAGAARWSGAEVEANVARLRPLIDEASRAASEVEYAKGAGRPVDAAAARARRARGALVAACNALSARAAGAPESLRPALDWGGVTALLDTKQQAAWPELRARAAALATAVTAAQAESDAKLYASNAGVRLAADALTKLTRAELAGRVAQRILGGDGPVRVAKPGDPIDHDGRAARGVVVFSDGRDAVPSDPRAVVCRAAPAAVRDLVVRGVEILATPYVGDPVPVRVTVGGVGVAGAAAKVHVTLDGADQVRDVTLGPGGAAVDVAATATRGGASKVVVRVDPVPGEATDRNNVAEQPVVVRTDRIGVVAIVGGGTDEAAAVRAVLSHVPGVSPVVERASAGATVRPATSPSAERIVVLGDVSAAQLSAERLDAIREFVVARGGTLVLAAGRSHWPLDAESETVFDEYLPYRVAGSRQVWRSAGARGVPASEGQVPTLSSVTRYLDVGPLRQGATTLVSDDVSGAPLLVESKLGGGRVLTLLAEPAAPAEFWSSLVRYLASPLADEAGARAAGLADDVSVDEAALRKLAGGGNVVPIAECWRLPGLVAAREPKGPAVVEYRLWDSPYLFLFVTACLTAEWSLRKRLGLA